MLKIMVEKLSREALEKKGVFQWPVWEKEISKFNWSYDSEETCYFLQGAVVVTPEKGEPVKFGTGDFVTFPKGMKCVWDIKEPVKKHYNFQ